MSLTVLVPAPLTRRRRLEAAEAPGRSWRRVPGGWIADLTALRKLVSLCPLCVHKFDPRGAGYELWRRGLYQFAVARCDDCHRVDLRCTLYIHASTHDAVGDWSRDPRRGRGRWAARGA